MNKMGEISGGIMKSAALADADMAKMKDDANKAFVRQQEARLANGNGTVYDQDKEEKLEKLKKELGDMKYCNTTEKPKNYKDLVEKANNISKRIIPAYIPENYTLDNKDTLDFVSTF
jgi:hypothetical protein